MRSRTQRGRNLRVLIALLSVAAALLALAFWWQASSWNAGGVAPPVEPPAFDPDRSVDSPDPSAGAGQAEVRRSIPARSQGVEDTAPRDGSPPPPELSLAGLVVAVVRGGDRWPVPGAVVEVVDEFGGGAPLAGPIAGGQDGRVELSVPLGELLIVAEDAQGGIGEARISVAGDGRHEVEVVLRDAISLEGRVLDAWTGRPIEGAEIWLLPLGRGRRVVTDSNGDFLLPSVPVTGAPHVVYVDAPGYGRENAWAGARDNGTWITIVPGLEIVEATDQQGVRTQSFALVDRVQEGTLPPARLVDVVLARERVIHGSVVRQDGSPLAGALIEAVGHYRVRAIGMAFPDEGRALTDVDGSFRLEGLRSDVGHTLQIQSDGYACKQLFAAPGHEPEHDCGTVRLDEELVLTGTVVDWAGDPVEDMRVRVSRAEKLERDPDHLRAFPRDMGHVPRLEFSLQTDRRGNFRVGGLSPGRWIVRAQADARPIAEAEVVLEEAQQSVALALPEGLTVVRGQVHSGGLPVASIQVEWALPNSKRVVTTGADGSFKIVGLHAGVVYRVRAVGIGTTHGERLASSELDFDPVDEFLELRLLP